MKKIILLAAILFSVPQISVAQNRDNSQGKSHNHQHVVVAGHILDITTGVKISYATVSVEGSDISVLSDVDGYYKLEDIHPGNISIVADMMGYKEKVIDLGVVNENIDDLDISLNPDAFSVDQVVVTSSRNAEKKTESANIVNVVSPRIFANTASVTPLDALNFSSGLRTEHTCDNCGASSLRINGLEGAYSQVLLDSRPMLSSMAMVYGLEQIPASMVERIEVVRGGGSTLYGANAVGGVVNIITKEPVKNSFSIGNITSIIGGSATDVNTSLDGSFVSDDTRTGLYLFGNIRNRQAYDYNGDGFSDIPELSSNMLGLRAYQKIGERGRITTEYHHIEEDRRGGDNVDLQPYETELAEMLDYTTDGGSFSYDYRNRSNKDFLNVYTSLQRIHRDSYFGTDYDLNSYGNSYNFTAATGVQWTHIFEKLWFMPSTLTAGAEHNYDFLDDEMPGYDRSIVQKVNTVGGYLQNEWKTTKVTALIGARVDKHSLVDNAIVSPRANFRYAPSEAVAFRFSYSSGYRAPQIYDEDLHIGAVGGEMHLISQADDLETEFSNSLSGSVDLYKTFGNVNFNLLVEGFYTHLKNVFYLEDIGEDASGNMLLERRNGEGAKVAGINTELRIAINNGIDIQIGYTYQQSKYTEAIAWSEDESIDPTIAMLRTPDDYGYITASYPFAKRFNASVNGTYTGKMLAPHYAGYIENDVLETTPSFFDLGARLSCFVPLSVNHLNLEVAAGVKNLLNSYQQDLDYGVNKDAGYIYGPSLPRTFFVSLRFYL